MGFKASSSEKKSAQGAISASNKHEWHKLFCNNLLLRKPPHSIINQIGLCILSYEPSIMLICYVDI